MADIIKTPSYDKATMLLSEGRLSEVFDFLCSIRHTLPPAQHISDQAGLLKDDLRRMLDYFAQGCQDPTREEMLERIRENAWMLCEELYNLESPVSSDSSISVAAAVYALQFDPTDDELLSQAFAQIADSRGITHADRNALDQTLLDENIPEFVRASLLSATMLYLLQRFDAGLLESLYVYTFDDQPVQLRVQAWTTLVLVAILHSGRIAQLPRLREQYRLMCENDPELMFQMQVALLQCCEARTVDQRMHEIVERIDDDDDQETLHLNMKEFFQFVTEGVDMSFSSFEHQCDIPFFNKPGNRHHWLMPFSTEQPDMKQILDSHPQAMPWVRMLMQSVAQCDTDRYATVLSMLNIADGRLLNVLGEKMEKVGLKFEDVSPLPFRCVMRSYLHDLYRFFALHPQAKKLRNQPFEADLKMYLNPWLHTGISNSDQLDKIGALLLRKGRWHEAAQTYEILLKAEMSEEGLQRLAYAYRRAAEPDGNLSLALKPLRRCNQLYPGNKRTLKAMADIQHEMADYVSEEITLHEALTLHTDDATLLTRLGRCLNAQGRYREAVEPLFRADLLKEGRRSTQYELATALLGTQNYDRAQRYALLAQDHDEAGDNEHILCGHLAMQRADMTAAMQSYSKADRQTAIHALQHDRPMLKDAGVDDTTIDLMCELLRLEPQDS